MNQVQSWALCLLAAAGGPVVYAQQLLNGDFQQAGLAWTNVIPATPNVTFADADGDADMECVFTATNLLAQNDNVILVQDFSAQYINLEYGIALNADIVATNLNNNIRAFTKLEFLLTNAATIGVDGAFNADNFVTGNVVRTQATLVKQRDELISDLAGMGLGLNAVAFVRATLFLYRFDTDINPPTGSGFFDNVSFGLVSASYDVPGLVNGGFEYNDWVWGNSPVSSDTRWIADDLDGDGDKELRFDASGLTNAFEGPIWIQEFDAKSIDFTQGVNFTTDIGATNLSPQFRAFSKLEFLVSTGILGSLTLDGFNDPSSYATGNQYKVAVALSKSYEAITNDLAAVGQTVDDITAVRLVLFMLSASASSTAEGYGIFDNAHLQFAFRDRPNVSAIRQSGGTIITWQSQTGQTYRVQQVSDLADFQWTNVALGISGLAGSTSFTNPAGGAVRFLRVVRDPD